MIPPPPWAENYRATTSRRRLHLTTTPSRRRRLRLSGFRSRTGAKASSPRPASTDTLHRRRSHERDRRRLPRGRARPYRPVGHCRAPRSRQNFDVERRFIARQSRPTTSGIRCGGAVSKSSRCAPIGCCPIAAYTSDGAGRGRRRRPRPEAAHDPAHVATDVLDATEGDLYAVKELLGHSSTKVTDLFALVPDTHAGRCHGPGRVSEGESLTRLYTLRRPFPAMWGEGAWRIRTAVRGFAGLCLTTRPTRREENRHI